MQPFEHLKEKRDDPCFRLSSRLCSSTLLNDNRYREKNKLDILSERLLLKIGNIHLNHFLEGNSTAPIDLPGTGQSWIPDQAKFVAKTVQFNFIRDGWTWSNQRHITTQDIPKLGEFIKAGCANKLPYSRHTRVT